MDKNAIKKFAIWARRELIERVSQKAMQYGITKDNIIPAESDSINGKVLTEVQKKQREALISQINDKGFEEVMEETAYTWFNRFIALRFMEVNGYIPTHVRVFTNEENSFKPQIIDEAIHLDLDGLNMEYVYELKNDNKTEELYKYLLITQCNALSDILPGMFQKISDYTELLFPDNLLREGSVVEQMITLIPEEDWKDAVQIIGWLYQYYNAERKEEVFAELKKNVKITKENIPAATQLFTPDWIVRYMVENSLGRLWIEGHPNDDLKSGWKYYLEEAQQDTDVEEQLAEIRKEYAAITPEQIKCIDPCCGSGHILVYMFDVLMQIYESYGYTTREAVESILKNNIYGLDIDDRAAQIAYFAVMMKARQYDRRFFSRKIQPNVYAIHESNNIDRYALDYFCNGNEKLKAAMDSIVAELHDAKEYGSILNITPVDFAALYARFDEVINDISISRDSVLNDLLPLVQVAEALAQKYDVVVTNPPYMGSSGMNAKLAEYVKKNYTDSKSDFFAIFIEVCGEISKKNGYLAMITQQTWMFISSFEKLREKLMKTDTVNMAHLGARAFDEIIGEKVQTTSFVMRKSHIKGYKGTYCRLIEPTTQQGKEDMFLSGENRYTVQQSNFSEITGSPVAYWANKVFRAAFSEPSLYSKSVSPSQNVTGNNDKYVRKHWELDMHKIGKIDKWIFYAKGGGFRRWYGNLIDVVNWTPQARKIYQYGDGIHASQIINKEYWYKKGITWGLITSISPSFRVMPEGATYDKGGSTIIVDEDVFNYTLGLLNSKVYLNIASMLNSTLNFQVKEVRSMPLVLKCKGRIEKLVTECIQVSESDWNSFETSWDFKRHPLLDYMFESEREILVEKIDADGSSYLDTGIEGYCSLENAYHAWKTECENRFQQLKANEEELNRIFINIYGLQDELTPEVEDKDVTVYRIFDSKEDIPASMGSSKYALTKQDVIKSLISYAVGCMFGRYSLDAEGLAFAGGEWDESKYITYPADKDNIIPICDDEYFDDDIVGHFVKFIETVYGSDTLEENLKFIADALGGNGQPKDIIRKYFLNDFYKDHCKTYQKRPIYWLFDSGKKNGFKALIYMHRYKPDTIARIRTDYVHEQQSRYRTAIADLEKRIISASTSERVKLNKELKKLTEQDAELHTYEEKIHHLADQMIAIDLDDGVKVNYAKFQDVLAKIK